MNDEMADYNEGTSELFASLLGDVSTEQWESFKEQQNEVIYKILICLFYDKHSSSCSFIILNFL